MSIQIGDRIPSATLWIMDSGKSTKISTRSYFDERSIVLFAVPGAFTPTCSISHLPGFVERAHSFFEKGINAIACLSVNDAFVMDAWGKSANAEHIDMLADGNGEFCRSLGLDLDKSEFGMGLRSHRFAFHAVDGVISKLLIEAPGEYRVSSAEHVLSQL